MTVLSRHKAYMKKSYKAERRHLERRQQRNWKKTQESQGSSHTRRTHLSMSQQTRYRKQNHAVLLLVHKAATKRQDHRDQNRKESLTGTAHHIRSECRGGAVLTGKASWGGLHSTGIMTRVVMKRVRVG